MEPGSRRSRSGAPRAPTETAWWGRIGSSGREGAWLSGGCVRFLSCSGVGGRQRPPALDLRFMRLERAVPVGQLSMAIPALEGAACEPGAERSQNQAQNVERVVQVDGHLEVLMVGGGHLFPPDQHRRHVAVDRLVDAFHRPAGSQNDERLGTREDQVAVVRGG